MPETSRPTARGDIVRSGAAAQHGYQAYKAGIIVNIFRLFQRWTRRGGNSEQNAPRVLPSTTSIPTRASRTWEQVDNNGPANDLAHQVAIQVVDNATAVGSHGAR